MMIPQTPYRVSFAGGRTDLPASYRREYRAIPSPSIDRRSGPAILVGYSRAEVADAR